MSYIDRFDVVEAYSCLLHDWNVGGDLQERPGASAALHRLRFAPRANLSYETLSEGGQAVYNAFLEKHRMCSGCDGRCFDTGMSCDQRIEADQTCAQCGAAIQEDCDHP